MSGRRELEGEGANQKHSPHFQIWQDEDLAWGGGFDEHLMGEDA